MKISIITICFNAVNTIEETILSVINQTFNNIEYIIIDGGSTDGTVDIIKKYAHYLTFWISEPDNGIYDAMNKGASHSSGDWIGYINAGDKYVNSRVLEKIANNLYQRSPDVLYGDLKLNYSFGQFISKPQELTNFNRCFPFSHPASFVKTEILKHKYFDLKYKIVADYNLFYSIYSEGGTFFYLPILIAEFEAEDGVSSKNILSSFKEVSKINGTVDKMGWHVKYLNLFIKDIIRKLIYKFCPSYYNLIIKNSIISRPYIQLIDVK